MTSSTAFHFPGAFQPQQHSSPSSHFDGSTTTPANAGYGQGARVHPGLFRPPPQSRSPPPLSSSATHSTTHIPLYTNGASTHHQKQQQEQQRRRINTAILRNTPVRTLSATKRKRGGHYEADGGSPAINGFSASGYFGTASTPLGSEWATPDSVFASPALGPVVTTPVYASDMGAGITGLGFPRKDGLGGNRDQYALGVGARTPRRLDGLDTRDLEDSVHSDVNYRRTGGSQRRHDQDADADVDVDADADADSNGVERAAAGLLAKEGEDGADGTKPATGWSKYTLSTIGGVIGKVLDFCTAGAFRGFYAGGGQGYAIQGDGTVKPADTLADTLASTETASADTFAEKPPSYAHQDLTPPQFCTPRQEPCAGVSTNDSDGSPRPAVKRRQVSASASASASADSNDELARNWVMVQDPDGRRFNGRVPVVRRNLPVQSALARRQHQHLYHRASAASSSSSATYGLNREPASFAPTRSPCRDGVSAGTGTGTGTGTSASPASPAPITPSKIPVASRRASLTPSNAHSRPTSRHQSSLPTPQRPTSSASSASAAAAAPLQAKPPPVYSSHGRKHSNASAATPRRPNAGSSGLQGIEASPHLTPEARYLAAQRFKAEHDADERMNTMNAQLEAMIRMGQEALSASFEVIDDAWMEED